MFDRKNGAIGVIYKDMRKFDTIYSNELSVFEKGLRQLSGYEFFRDQCPQTAFKNKRFFNIMIFLVISGNNEICFIENQSDNDRYKSSVMAALQEFGHDGQTIGLVYKMKQTTP